MLFIAVNLFLVCVIILGLLVIWVVWPPDSPWAPWWRTKNKEAIATGKLAKISSKDLVYELGSGDANFLVAVCKKFKCKGFGVEIDPVRHLAAKLNIAKNGVAKEITVKRGNFYDFNYSEATVVFCYLIPRVLEQLKPKLLKELKKGTRIISYRYEFEQNPPSHKASEGQAKKLKLVTKDKKSEMNLYKIN